jgi:prophage maintenance system killer protein
MSKTNQNDQIVIYRDNNDEIIVDVKVQDETVWLSLNQLTELFDRDKSVISRHIKNIFNEEELEEDSVVAKFATTASDGKVYNVDYYNLDMIISVGYRVNSKRAVEFRRWATGILKDYLIKGYSINHKKLMVVGLEELKQTVLLLSNTLLNQGLVNDMGTELLKLIKAYGRTWELLLKYDEDRLEMPTFQTSNKEYNKLEYSIAKYAIERLKSELIHKKEATNLFGHERSGALEGIIGNLYQTFDGKELYPSIEEKAAHLLYFIIKDHPFSDGNKRIGCLLFLFYLSTKGVVNTIKSNEAGEYIYEKYVTPESLTMLALLIAESDPMEKEIMIKLTVNLIREDG